MMIRIRIRDYSFHCGTIIIVFCYHGELEP